MSEMIFSPGMRVRIRDAEWFVKRVATVKTGGQALYVRDITYYDQNGRRVFSAKSGESYLSRQEWESIRGMTEGEFTKTITETVFSDTPTERTITYKAPFFRKDREADYREAWEMLERRT